MFIKSEKHPSPPFTRNYLTHKMLNKKVKGEGLKTLFYIYARQGKNERGTLGSKIGKTLKKEYNIKIKNTPFTFTSQKSHPKSCSACNRKSSAAICAGIYNLETILFRKYHFILRRYFPIYRRYYFILRR